MRESEKKGGEQQKETEKDRESVERVEGQRDREGERKVVVSAGRKNKLIKMIKIRYYAVPIQVLYQIM